MSWREQPENSNGVKEQSSKKRKDEEQPLIAYSEDKPALGSHFQIL